MSNHTSRDHEQHGVLDDAIDRAVRAMMSAEAPAGLRRRVMARIDAPEPRTPWFPRLAIPAAAIAAIVLAVVLLRPSPAPERPSAPPATEQAAITSPLPSPHTAAPTGAPPAGAPRTATAGSGITQTPIRMPRIANPFGARSANVAAAASDVEEVVFTEGAREIAPDEMPGAPPRLSVPAITVAPLHVEWIAVGALPTRK